MYISGSENALPRNGKFIRPAKIVAKFGTPLIPACSADHLNYQEFSLQVMQAIRSLQ
jgi:hypothetical protein